METRQPDAPAAKDLDVPRVRMWGEVSTGAFAEACQTCVDLLL